MDFSAIKDLYIGSTPVQSAWLNGSKVWGRKPAVDEQSIRDAMILWYDLKKQGATNESMAENPVLRDLSGNGHDATCYNFAWADMSGIGGYTIPPFTSRSSNFLSSKYFTGDSYNLIGKPQSNEAGLYWDCTVINNPTEPYKLHLNVSGIVEGNNVYIHQYNNAYYGSVALVNGENRIQIDITQGDRPDYPYLSFHADSSYETDIHIEILPEYPNALVSDGVDDYCLVEGLPLLNKEDGYTVIAKRKILSSPIGVASAGIASKRITPDETGAFVFEKLNNVEGVYNIVWNFGAINNNVLINKDTSISVLTSTMYNNANITKGANTDNDMLLLFSGLKTNIGYGEYASTALYSFLLFNRDLSIDEIEWVKTNLIESEQ